MNTILAIEQAFYDYLIDQISIHDISDGLWASEQASVSAPNVLDVDGSGKATIQISGPLSMNGPSGFMKFLGVGGTSYRSIIQAANEAREDEDIKTVRLLVNSPGGDISGVDNAWSAIRELAKEKHVIAENHGLMASAAYWLASAADEILAVNPTAQTGSIGVIITSYGSNKKYTVSSKNAPNKVLDIESKKDRGVIQDRADALERIFISRVAEGRGVSEETVKKKFGRGDVLVAQDPDKSKADAIKAGLIDGLLTKEEARCTPEKASTSGVGVQSATEPAETCGEGQQQEDVEMTLNELFEKHPELKNEVQGLIDSAVKAETDKADRVAAFLKSDYPKEIRELATGVLKGDKEIAALEGAAVAWDAMNAAKVQTEAIEEQAEDTTTQIIPDETKNQVLETGICESNEDFDALIEAEKAGV